MDNTPSQQQKINDRCPSWAIQLIAKIRDIEIEAGNINPPGDWKEKNLEALEARVFGHAGQSDDAETLFVELAKGLTKEGFSAVEIAQFVNSRIVSGGKLVYCSHTEVLEVIG